MINRRKLIKGLICAPAIVSINNIMPLAPWLVETKSGIIVPKNSFITPDLIAKEALAYFNEQLKMNKILGY